MSFINVISLTNYMYTVFIVVVDLHETHECHHYSVFIMLVVFMPLVLSMYSIIPMNFMKQLLSCGQLMFSMQLDNAVCRETSTRTNALLK